MKASRKTWRLDRDGRVSPQACGLDWRVIAADQGRVDPAVDYLFCAPDFLFPVDGLTRALRLEVDAQRAEARKSTPTARAPAAQRTRGPVGARR